MFSTVTTAVEAARLRLMTDYYYYTKYYSSVRFTFRPLRVLIHGCCRCSVAGRDDCRPTVTVALLPTVAAADPGRGGVGMDIYIYLLIVNHKPNGARLLFVKVPWYIAQEMSTHMPVNKRRKACLPLYVPLRVLLPDW